MEVCVDSLKSAMNAIEGGASRLEVCSALVSEGGLTPSLGLVKAIRKIAQPAGVPVFVMIRPRGGSDFLYSEEEVKVMLEDIEALEELADGMVFGALTRDGRVNLRTCSRLLRAVSNHHPTTFHRAFDLVKNPKDALEELIGLGFDRVLTSGGRDSAEDGADLLDELIEQATDRITVMPGGGVTSRNLERLLKSTGAKEFHGSAKVKVPLGDDSSDPWIYETSADEVRAMLRIHQEYKAYLETIDWRPCSFKV